MFSYIREMNETDLDWVLAVERRCQRQPWTRDGFERALHQGMNFMFCDTQAEPLGYACLLPVVDELHLLNITVDSAFQGQGIGKAAMQNLFERFSHTHYAVMLLEVRKSNKVARQLYLGLGFEQDGIRKQYYVCENGREDAVLMSRRLDG